MFRPRKTESRNRLRFEVRSGVFLFPPVSAPLRSDLPTRSVFIAPHPSIHPSIHPHFPLHSFDLPTRIILSAIRRALVILLH